MPREDKYSTDDPEQPIWDLFVRVFHWLLVLVVLGGLLTGFFGGYLWLDVHVVLGCSMISLVAARVIWGFAGSRHARFADFVASPVRVLHHVRELVGGTAPRHAGHNPLGGAMILALLGLLLALSVTGLLGLGGVVKEGPLAPFVSYELGRSATRLHELAAFAILAAIMLHVGGVMAESWRTRENLVAAMIGGRKRPGGETTAAARAIKARPAYALGAVLALSLPAIPAVAYYSSLPPRGVPQGGLDPLLAKECGSCHAALHPSLAPSATWKDVMAHLDDHFGENASLDDETAKRVTGLLDKDASEHWDTAAANRLRRRSAAEPLRITATDGWQRIHHGVAPVVFQTPPIVGAFNCGKCHADADSGRFARRAIAIPTSRAAEKTK